MTAGSRSEIHEETLLGIDLGTSSCKALLVGLDGRTMGLAAQEYPIDIPQPGWAEQDPRAWVDACRAAVRGALAVAAGAGKSMPVVKGIGLSGQMHGLVCVDGKGQPVRPAIIWADQRSRRQVEQISRRVSMEQLGEWTGNPMATGFWPPSWMWLLENEPETVQRTRRLILPKDYLRFAMTGEMGVEESDASSTLVFDTGRREWSQEAARAFGIDEALLLPAHGSSEIAGMLREGFASEVGLPEGIPVVYGGSDQALALLGQGITHAGQLSCAISTGGQMVTPLGGYRYDPDLRLNTFCHALPGHWYLEAATLSAGLSLRWLRDHVFPGSSYAALADLADAVPGSEGVFFLPHLVGERTPYMDAEAKAGFWGLGLRHTQGHLVRAVMEGVVFSLRACLELIEGLGAPVEQVVASGGGTRHPLWLHLMADIFDRPVTVSGLSEASAAGAALLAGMGVGIYADAASAWERTEGERVTPDPARVEGYDRAYETYKKLYSAFKMVRNSVRE
jgi:xylulokinase